MATTSKSRENIIRQIYFPAAFFICTMHIGAINGFGIVLTGACQWKTVFFGVFTSWMALLGVSVGAHRYWSHKTFKAKLPLDILLKVMFSLSGQYSVLWWARKHRTHHKFADTEDDPININQGFWYAHIGWTFFSLRSKLKKESTLIELDDLKKDWFLRFQHRFNAVLLPLTAIIIPMLIPYYFWGETLLASFCIVSCWKTVYSLHSVGLVNSVGHTFGYRPYDKSIAATNNKWVSYFTTGEGWHNFHHTFPWDYMHSDFGSSSDNQAAMFIHVCAWLGLAYDLKTVTKEHAEKIARRKGDGSIYELNRNRDRDDDRSWGWGDKDISLEKLQVTQILYPKK